jgi:hypothetical protein
MKTQRKKFVFALFLLFNILYSGTVTIQYDEASLIDCPVAEFQNSSGTTVYYNYANWYEFGEILSYPNGRKERYYVKYIFPDFMQEAVIDSAVFKIYLFFHLGYNNQDFSFIINQLSSNLTENYENTGGLYQPPDFYNEVIAVSETFQSNYVGWVNFDVTDLLDGWLNFYFDNYGFVVQMQNEIIQGKSFFQSSCTEISLRPILQVSGSNLPDTLLTSNGVVSNDIEIINYNNPCLLNNYPNPFNPTTTIEFSINNDSKIDLSIFNIKGQKIKTLTKNNYTEGTHSIIWEGDDEFGKSVGSGVFYYKLKVNGKIEAVKKCLLLK